MPKGEKITQKDAQINIKEILNTELGEEYSWLTDKLSVGLDKIINGLVEAKLAPLQAENQQIREDNARSAISSALDPIIEEIGAVEFDRIAPKLTETMQKYPRPAAQTVKSYMKDMMKLVSDKTAPNTEKIKKNIREAKRPSSGTNENRVKTGSKLPTYREGIEAAMRGERFE